MAEASLEFDRRKERKENSSPTVGGGKKRGFREVFKPWNKSTWGSSKRIWSLCLTAIVCPPSLFGLGVFYACIMEGFCCSPKKCRLHTLLLKSLFSYSSRGPFSTHIFSRVEFPFSFYYYCGQRNSQDASPISPEWTFIFNSLRAWRNVWDGAYCAWSWYFYSRCSVVTSEDFVRVSIYINLCTSI